MSDTCSVDDCGKPVYAYARSSGLCRGHYARKAKGRDLSTPLRSWRNAKRALFEAALALGFVEGDEDEFLRVIRRFWAAHKRAALVFRNKVTKRADSRVHARRNH